LLRDLLQMVVMTDYLVVFIQHQVVHLALIQTVFAVRVVLLTLQTSGLVLLTCMSFGHMLCEWFRSLLIQ
jgi:hypothetical protein